MPVTLVADSYHFIENVIPGTIQELANEEAVDELFSAISDNGHRILITDRGAARSISREYQAELKRRHLAGFIPQLIELIDQLRIRGTLIVRRDVPRHEVANLSGSHQIFIEDAVACDVDYLVAHNLHWNPPRRRGRPSLKLKIVDAWQFVTIASEIDP